MYKFNYVALDTSLSSTGLYILTKDGSEHYFNYKKGDKLSKWHRTCSFINYRDYDVLDGESYSDNEVIKLIKYDQITDEMVKDILSIVKPEESIIITEGYSFSSSSGRIIHLTTYGTLIRSKLLRLNFADFIIKSPSSLKSQVCEYTYGAIFNSKGKKLPSRNKDGLAGGSFTKFEILQSMFDSDIECKIKTILLPHKEELLSRKSLPTPLTDMIDALWLVYTSIID